MCAVIHNSLGLRIWAGKEVLKTWKMDFTSREKTGLNFLRKSCIPGTLWFTKPWTNLLSTVWVSGTSLCIVHLPQNEIMECKRQEWNPIPHLNEGGKRKRKKKYNILSLPKIWAWLRNGNNWTRVDNIWRAYTFSFGGSAYLYWC